MWAGIGDAQTFQEFVGRLKQRNSQEIAAALGIPAENTSLLYLSAIMIKHMMKVLGAKTLWAPGVSLCDGIAYEYAEKNKVLSVSHNFEQDAGGSHHYDLPADKSPQIPAPADMHMSAELPDARSAL